MFTCTKVTSSLLLLVVFLQSQKAVSLKGLSKAEQQDSTNVARDQDETTTRRSQPVAGVKSHFFINERDVDKGLDQLKKTFPDVDWSLLKILPKKGSEKRETDDRMANLFKRRRDSKSKGLSSTFVFLNQTDIDKGLDHLKHKYPKVNWSLVTPLRKKENGRREMNSERKNFIQHRRQSTFFFVNQTDIDKGLDHLKKKYPNVDWSLVTPLPKKGSGKRETNSERKNFIQHQRQSTFFFINQTDIDKGLAHLKKKYPNVDWSLVTPLPKKGSGRREMNNAIDSSFKSRDKKVDVPHTKAQERNEIPNTHKDEMSAEEEHETHNELASKFSVLGPENDQKKMREADWLLVKLLVKKMEDMQKSEQ